jgi:hypothetical protein
MTKLPTTLIEKAISSDIQISSFEVSHLIKLLGDESKSYQPENPLSKCSEKIIERLIEYDKTKAISSSDYSSLVRKAIKSAIPGEDYIRKVIEHTFINGFGRKYSSDLGSFGKDLSTQSLRG